MLQILKEIILDYQSLSLRTGIPRATKLTAIKGKATVCIGVRRSGKIYVVPVWRFLLQLSEA